MAFFLGTSRLLLRTFQDANLDAFIAYRSDPAVARYQGWQAPYSRAVAVAFVQEMNLEGPAAPGEWH